MRREATIRGDCIPTLKRRVPRGIYLSSKWAQRPLRLHFFSKPPRRLCFSHPDSALCGLTPLRPCLENPQVRERVRPGNGRLVARNRPFLPVLNSA